MPCVRSKSVPSLFAQRCLRPCSCAQWESVAGNGVCRIAIRHDHHTDTQDWCDDCRTAVADQDSFADVVSRTEYLRKDASKSCMLCNLTSFTSLNNQEWRGVLCPVLRIWYVKVRKTTKLSAFFRRLRIDRTILCFRVRSRGIYLSYCQLMPRICE